MGFSELEKQRIKKIVGEYCDEKIPEHVGHYRHESRRISGTECEVGGGRYAFDRVTDGAHALTHLVDNRDRGVIDGSEAMSIVAG